MPGVPDRILPSVGETEVGASPQGTPISQECSEATDTPLLKPSNADPDRDSISADRNHPRSPPNQPEVLSNGLDCNRSLAAPHEHEYLSGEIEHAQSFDQEKVEHTVHTAAQGSGCIENNDTEGGDRKPQTLDQLKPRPTQGQLLSTKDAPGNQQSKVKYDVLYVFRALEKDKPDRRSFQTSPFKGIDSGLQVVQKEDKSDYVSIIEYFIDVEGKDKTEKEGCTRENWHEKNTSFEFCVDFIVEKSRQPLLKVISPKLVSVLKSLIEYYPPQVATGTYSEYHLPDGFRTLLHHYRELKEYYKPDRQKAKGDEAVSASKPSEVTGDAGDEQ